MDYNNPSSPINRFDTLQLAEGLRLILRGLGIVMSQFGDYAVKVALDRAVPNEEIEKLVAEDIQKDSELLSSKLGKAAPVDQPTAGAKIAASSSASAEQPKPTTASQAAASAPKLDHKAKSTKAANAAKASVSLEEITKLIVIKLKQNDKANDPIQKLVHEFGVSSVKEIPEEKRNDFYSRLKEIQ